MYSSVIFIAVLSPLFALAQQTAWGQCGGVTWSGPTTCVSGYTCVESSEYYSQCLPGGPSTTPGTTLTTSAKPPPTTTTKGSSSTTIAGSGIGPGTTLQPNYYWIRSVESPNFHAYLQTSPQDTVGTAILDSYTTAGQFQIVNGQLVELINTSGSLLYANVEPQANASVTMLSLSFETTMNTYGTFAFQGDAVTWSIPSIARPNTAAWLVCANQQLFINLGAYDYMTPAGCADETIHYYNGATAVD